MTSRLYYVIMLFLGIPLCALSQGPSAQAPARPAYFIDGYHGGIYGHIPTWQTRFMIDKLREYPDWKINLELEPESWDTIAADDLTAYAEFKAGMADSSFGGRVEYVNPAYGQSYLYNISGESIIRQFYYGMRKLRQHFPGIVFSTYSSEEPCFTSALPQILRSYGFKYASLKNPNTCWGGYTRAYGGELIDWIGPDGTRLLTVPRYAVEALKPHSTWETIASNNSVAYVQRAFGAGIGHPVGMCLQDAGWANGPWIKPGEPFRPRPGDPANDVTRSYQPTLFETWRGYFEQHTNGKAGADWHFSQEDVLTSLVWGGQILQAVARKTRAAENRIVAAEKLASMAAVLKGTSWPGASFDEAWRTLLLSQHHDCWIVPYNRLRGSTFTWADWVDRWTANTINRSDTIGDVSMAALAPGSGPMATANGSAVGFTVFNTTVVGRNECVEVALPVGWVNATVTSWKGDRVVTQSTAAGKLLFRATVPPLGAAVYHLQQAQQGRPPQAAQSSAEPVGKSSAEPAGARVAEQNDKVFIETDLYSIILDASKGGAITRLATRGPLAKNFVDEKASHYFNELRGNFYHDGGFRSSAETPARVRLIEKGPLRVRVQIDGEIAGTPFTQLLTVMQGEPRIDVHLEIHWTGDHKIGESPDSIKGYPLKKEFYNDSFKLQALFPLALHGQKVYKNAPFDVLQSRLPDTFFDSWDSIRNVVMLNWVDVTDAADKYGLAVFSDETTSYAHGPHYPLGLTVAYSGPGLFGRDYSITGPTIMDYAILPHTGRWDKAGIWTAGTRWNEPLLARGQTAGAVQPGQAVEEGRSLLRMGNPGWEVSSVNIVGHDLLVRLFNAEGKDSVQNLCCGFPAKRVSLIALDGHVIKQLDVIKNTITITAPRFGIRTIQFKDVVK